MTGAELKALLLRRPESYEDTPFGPQVLVYKIRHKMFATLSRVPGTADDLLGMNLKCDPQQALILREQYAAVRPGYHMNKTHWNTIILDGSVPDDELGWMVHHSYALVTRSLPRRMRIALELTHGSSTLYGGDERGYI